MRPMPSDQFETPQRHDARSIQHFQNMRAGIGNKLREPSEKAPSPPPSQPAFVLYVHNKCTTSQSLLAQLEKTPIPNIFIQNIALLQDRPRWLDGVPVLADTKLGVVYKGTDCIVFLDKLSRQSTESFIAEPVAKPALPSKPMNSLFVLEEDVRKNTSDKPGQKFSEQSIADLMDARAAHVPPPKIAM